MSELAIYFEKGSVAYFKKVKNFDEYFDEKTGRRVIEFDYFGDASRKKRHAKFEYYSGWSIAID